MMIMIMMMMMIRAWKITPGPIRQTKNELVISESYNSCNGVHPRTGHARWSRPSWDVSEARSYSRDANDTISYPQDSTLSSPKVKRGVEVGYRSTRSLKLGVKWWVVNATLRQLYPQERPGTPSIGGWMGPGDDPDSHGKSRPHRDLIPGPSIP